MEGVSPGTLLGGRYALRRRLSQDHDLERWSAHDSTLEREVALTLVDSDHPNRAGILDAARRAAGVEDTSLVRILDVGTQGGNSFIVEEAMSGSESLAAILLQGPLPAEEARRIAGETARGLETAGQRGLHHLRLTPHCVLIAPDGSIRVSGVAVAAAIDGPDEQEPDPATASRRDAVCVVAVAYAALTGRWPLDEQVSGVESAPRVVDEVAAPSEIAAGVPDDLDALCRMTLNEGTGPLTPGDFASQIAPWSRDRVHRAGVEPTVVLPLPSLGDVTDVVPVNAGGTEPTVAKATAAGATATKAARATKAAGATLAGAGAAAGVVGGKLSSLARAAADKGARAGADLGSKQMTLPGGLSSQFDDVEPPLPMLPASAALPPSRGQTKIVVLVMVMFVALSLFVGYRGLRGPSSDTRLSRSTPSRTVAVKAPPVKVPASPAPKKGVIAAGPIAILSATGFDPEGDRSEKSSQAGRVYDGNLATAWTSESYHSAQFGNLKKGAGVLLDLGQPTSVHKVTINLGSGPVDVTVYAATHAGLAGATPIGAASAASGRIQLKAAKAMPEAQYIIVWFTRLAPDGGQFRASISEIALN
ncbi:MAG: protein kinase family protein [Actinobacteria bacterium]|nr:protein kinase family protein [Actinomycetota bacterium]